MFLIMLPRIHSADCAIFNLPEARQLSNSRTSVHQFTARVWSMIMHSMPCALQICTWPSNLIDIFGKQKQTPNFPTLQSEFWFGKRNYITLCAANWPITLQLNSCRETNWNFSCTWKKCTVTKLKPSPKALSGSPSKWHTSQVCGEIRGCSKPLA